MEEVRSHWNWVSGSGFLNNSEFSFIRRLARNALPLFCLIYKTGLTDMPDCPYCSSSLEETAEHGLLLLSASSSVLESRQRVDGSHRTQAVRAARRWLRCKQCVNFSHHDLILFFRNQLRVKIKCDRKRLDCITFNRRWVHTTSLVVWKRAILESSFFPLPAHSDYGQGPSGSRHRWVGLLVSILSLVSHFPRHLLVSLQDLLRFHSLWFSKPLIQSHFFRRSWIFITIISSL